MARETTGHCARARPGLRCDAGVRSAAGAPMVKLVDTADLKSIEGQRFALHKNDWAVAKSLKNKKLSELFDVNMNGHSEQISISPVPNLSQLAGDKAVGVP